MKANEVSAQQGTWPGCLAAAEAMNTTSAFLGYLEQPRYVILGCPGNTALAL